MRLQSEKKVTVKNKVLGGPIPLICLPLIAKDRSALLQQTAELVRLDPDLIEWRIDGYDQVTDIGACLAALQALKAAMGSIPLIFTCRIHVEGGFKKISQETRLELITTAVGSGNVEIVDVEICNEPAFIEKVKKTTQTGNAKLILSYHNFDKTPDETFIYDKLLRAQDLGADIAKLAVMPKDYADVLTLLGATLKARTGRVNVPIVTMSMGPEGQVTRVAGGLFGSDLTFAVGKEASAPGQIPIGGLRQAMKVLYE
ncbi:MAG: type I 3-dehydroquinate dehydratase [Desulfobacterales bacterium]